MTIQTPRLGIDIGRVIIDGPGPIKTRSACTNRNEDTGFFDGDEAALLATPEMPGAFDAIACLVLLFDGQVWLVSKCGTRIQERTQYWLNGHNFWYKTGIRPQNIRFCRQRPEKRNICLELGITHFVDDRPDVLTAMKDVVPHRYLFGPQQQRWRYGIVTAVPNWAEAEAAIRKDFEKVNCGSRYKS